ncbi:DUF402 domain-containing protein [Nonomuraea sp. NPDC001636]|uniref:DUF402 domain-containing protein n=1 Tax=Nonomuraea sp. NPDC001636 TaxID=3154391 RepID=UPI00331920E1
MLLNEYRRFDAGATAVRRHVWNEKVWSAAPYRVLHDTEEFLVVAGWPGLRGLVSTTWINSFVNGGSLRERTIRELASGEWNLGWWAWQGTTVRSWYGIHSYFTVRQYFDTDQNPLAWYVDFDLPKRRTLMGIDTFDLLLDLVADPDLSQYRWKDEDEYQQGRRLGLISDDTHRHVTEARSEVIGLIEDRLGPFAHDWAPLQWEAWQTPTLPENIEIYPAAAHL